jgi:plasmid stabilization system protein ParE
VKAEFQPAASEEIVETAAYYDREVPGLGSGFIIEVERIVGILRDQPTIGQRIEKEFRRILLARFPYSFIYCVESERIWVVAVAHQHRRPGYWRERIDR